MNRGSFLHPFPLLPVLLLACVTDGESLEVRRLKPIDVKSVSPEIVKQMDNDIVRGNKPQIVVLTAEDIFDLRQNPKLQGDFVSFRFDVSKLSTAQRQALDKWLTGGHNRIYLETHEITGYQELFGLVAETRYDAGMIRLLAHPVNADCKQVEFAYGNVMHFENLPADSEAILRNGNKVYAGSFKVGKTTVFFRNEVKGNDAPRWNLNYWHWAMGLLFPGNY